MTPSHDPYTTIRHQQSVSILITHQITVLDVRDAHENNNLVALSEYILNHFSMKSGGETYVEEHKVLWVLSNTVARCSAFSDAALYCETGPAGELGGVHGRRRTSGIGPLTYANKHMRIKFTDYSSGPGYCSYLCGSVISHHIPPRYYHYDTILSYSLRQTNALANSTTALPPKYTKLHHQVQSKTNHARRNFTIVSPDKRIPVLIRDSPIHMFLRLLQRYVHISIKAAQNTSSRISAWRFRSLQNLVRTSIVNSR
jgi:hypothetical protein